MEILVMQRIFAQVMEKKENSFYLYNRFVREVDLTSPLSNTLKQRCTDHGKRKVSD